MITITNVYKRLLIYTLITNKFPLQCTESIWYLIQLSELPIRIDYTDSNMIKCQLITYNRNMKYDKQYKDYQPRNAKEEQIVETFLQMIYYSSDLHE